MSIARPPIHWIQRKLDPTMLVPTTCTIPVGSNAQCVYLTLLTLDPMECWNQWVLDLMNVGSNMLDPTIMVEITMAV